MLVELGIVGNKTDLFEKEEVSEHEARELAKENKAEFFLVSAANGDNIDTMFINLIEKYNQKMKKKETKSNNCINSTDDSFTLKEKTKKGENKCCH